MLSSRWCGCGVVSHHISPRRCGAQAVWFPIPISLVSRSGDASVPNEMRQHHRIAAHVTVPHCSTAARKKPTTHYHQVRYCNRDYTCLLSLLVLLSLRRPLVRSLSLRLSLPLSPLVPLPPPLLRPLLLRLRLLSRYDFMFVSDISVFVSS